jgi:hypothetical protein
MALQFPIDARSYEGSMRFTLVNNDGAPISNSQVELYLPQGIQIADKVEYENSDLGAVGGAIANGGGGGEGTPISEAMNDPELKKSLVDGLVAKVGAKAGDAFRARNKLSPNPNTRALFKQVSLRSFQFSFKMIPTSEEEAKNIEEIIKFFRTELYPEDIVTEVGGISTSLAYKFPNRFKAEMTYAGSVVGPKIAPAYLDSFTTNYNGTSATFIKKGDGRAYFSEIDINFSLTESTALSRKSIESEGY